jgi:DNA-binding response OmpR family regulator
MTEQRNVLVLGAFSSPERNRIARIGQESAFEVHFENEPHAATDWLDQHETQALLLDSESMYIERFALERRAESRHATLPLLSLAKAITDLCFVEAFSWGADDVVSRGDEAPLRSRLRQLPKEPMVLPESARGQVLVAEPDRNRRILIGRVLRNAGYSVTFAAERDDLFNYAATKSLDVIVASTALTEAPRELVEDARKAGSQALFVVTCPPRDLKKYRSELDELGGVTTTDAYAPAENVLFVSNELGRPRGIDQRASARMLYGTAVGFRGVGREADDYGFTYNISEGGLYVRTLAPPDDDMVWLELCPPRDDRRVRLVGRVAWRRSLANGQYATVPPGFGLEIVDGARMDIAAWRTGCQAFQRVVA